MNTMFSILWRFSLTFGALVFLASCGNETPPNPLPATRTGTLSFQTPPVVTPAGSPSGAPTFGLPSATLPIVSKPTTPTPLADPGKPTYAHIITLEDNGKTVPLTLGDRVLLNLGDDYNWTASVQDSSILIAVADTTSGKGTQGVYEARAVGTTNLRAAGGINCPPQKACILIVREFAVRIVVSQ